MTKEAIKHRIAHLKHKLTYYQDKDSMQSGLESARIQKEIEALQNGLKDFKGK